MSSARFFWVALVLCGKLIVTSTNATALICGQPETVPPFASTLDINTIPQPPAEPYSLSKLDLYRAKLEIFRQNTLEGYNRKLLAYGESLNQIDANAREALKSQKCTASEYEALKKELQSQSQKIRTEYIEPYTQGITAYKEYMSWCKLEIARVRFALHDFYPMGIGENSKIWFSRHAGQRQ